MYDHLELKLTNYNNKYVKQLKKLLNNQIYL